jgi:hypothetical protein
MCGLGVGIHGADSTHGNPSCPPYKKTHTPQVKALLEGGTFLTPAMLQGCVDCVADFTHSCGLLRHNRFLLPLLAFVRKCTGVSQEDFDAMVAAAGLGPAIYGTASLDQPQASGSSLAATLQQQQQLEAVPEDGEVPAGAESLQLARPAAVSGGGSASRPQTSNRPPSSAGSAAAAVAPACVQPGVASSVPASPGRASIAGAAQKPPDLQLERCTSPATGTAPATSRASCISGSGDSSSSSRGGSSSGGSTGRARHSSAAAAKVASEGPSLPGGACRWDKCVCGGGGSMSAADVVLRGACLASARPCPPMHVLIL